MIEITKTADAINGVNSKVNNKITLYLRELIHDCSNYIQIEYMLCAFDVGNMGTRLPCSNAVTTSTSITNHLQKEPYKVILRLFTHTYINLNSCLIVYRRSIYLSTSLYRITYITVVTWKNRKKN